MEDFERYCNDTPAVLQISQEIAAVLQNMSRNIEIRTILDVMNTVSSETLSGKHTYRSMRVARAIIFMLQLRQADSENDWQCYRSMSTYIEGKMKSSGIWSFGDAVKMRDAIRDHLSEPAYGFGDLACLACLMQ